MKKNDPDKIYKRIEEAVKSSFTEPVDIDRSFKRNLDKIVENTINLKSEEKLKGRDQANQVQGKEVNIFNYIFKGAKWNFVLTMMIVTILSVSGIVYAAVPQVREAISNTVVAKQGEIKVTTEPQKAEVYIKEEGKKDFEFVGSTPLEYKLKPGSYQLKVIREKYKESITRFDVKSEEVKDMFVELEKLFEIIDKLTEWEIYNDYINGFELEYPFGWKKSISFGSEFNGSEHQEKGIEFVGKNSKLRVYSYSEDILDNYDLDEISVNEKKYTGLKHYDEWPYVIVGEKSSDDGSNKVRVVFFTKYIEELEIYDFIFDSFKVSPLIQEDENETWSKEENQSIGLTFRYPSVGWVVQKKDVDLENVEYQVKQEDSELVNLSIIYSYGYLSRINDYTYVGPEEIGEYEVESFVLDEAEESVVYGFPNGIYTFIEFVQDSEVNSVVNEIVDTLEIVETSEYVRVFNYEKEYSISIPNNWSFVTSSDYEEILDSDSTLVVDEKGNFSLSIVKGENIVNQWDAIFKSLNPEDLYLRESVVLIGEGRYVRMEIWDKNESVYQLKQVLYLNEEGKDKISDWDPYVQTNGEKYLITLSVNLEAYDLDNIPDQTEKDMLVADKIVSSLRYLEY